MNREKIDKYLANLEDKLLNESEQFKIEITRKWVQQFPPEAAVYLFRENGKVCYIGETGNLRGRMGDILNTYHHTLRRNLGHHHFSSHPFYEKASSRNKYAPEIELLLNELIENHLTMSFLLTGLGRKELEERLFEKLNPIYSLKGKRGFKQKI